MTQPRPCSPTEAIQRARVHVGHGVYGLGRGGYRADRPDSPFDVVGVYGYCDCWAFAFCFAYRVPGHRPGFNAGPWATVADDVNCDSGIEDAEHKRELFEVVKTPRLGDLLVFPSIRGPDHKRIRIGHVGLVVDVPAEWDEAVPRYDLLEVIQCQASRKPAVIRGPGTAWSQRERFKGLLDDAWRTRILRPKP